MWRCTRRGAVAISTAVATFGALQQRERTFEHSSLFCRERFERLGPDSNFRFVDRAEASARWNQVAEDDVLLETDEVVRAAQALTAKGW